MSFKKKVVLITGASSGIGAATAIEFAKQDAKVAIVGRNEQKLKKTYEQCSEYGPKPLLIVCDVTKDDQVERMIGEVTKKFGKLNVLVNNAGMAKYGSLLDGNIMDAYDCTMSVNVRAHINVTAKAIPLLIKSKGNIVNVSSVAATITPFHPQQTPYFVSKAALNHFTRCAASELAGVGVRVNTVSPGPVYTDFLDNAGDITITFDQVGDRMPLRRVSEPREVADVIMFLASEKAIGVTASEYMVDNGAAIM